jgi:hypothetical protein
MTHPFAGNGSSLHYPSELLQLWSALQETYWALSAKHELLQNFEFKQGLCVAGAALQYNLNTHHFLLISSVNRLNC